MLSLLFILISPAFAEDENKLCSGPHALLLLINRPTIAYSPCSVPEKDAIFEQGYQAQRLTLKGSEQNFPAVDVRFGLPANNEFFVLVPNYTLQSIIPRAGFSATSIGLKHELHYTDTWLLTALGVVTPPSGSVGFGEKGIGGTISGVFTYSILDTLGFTCQFGVTTETLPPFYGGQRFTSFDQDVFLTWLIKDKLQLFGEVYGRSKTAPHQGSGYNANWGLVILVTPNLTLDLEAGQRLRGQLGSLENYIGAGVAIWL